MQTANVGSDELTGSDSSLVQKLIAVQNDAAERCQSVLDDEVFGGGDLIGICFTAAGHSVGHAVGQFNLLRGVGSCIPNHACCEVVGHGKTSELFSSSRGAGLPELAAGRSGL